MSLQPFKVITLPLPSCAQPPPICSLFLCTDAKKKNNSSSPVHLSFSIYVSTYCSNNHLHLSCVHLSISVYANTISSSNNHVHLSYLSQHQNSSVISRTSYKRIFIFVPKLTTSLVHDITHKFIIKKDKLKTQNP